MNETMNVNKLVATYGSKRMDLGGPYTINFNVIKEAKVAITMSQIGNRQIIVSSDKEISYEKLYSMLTTFEKLLMIIDGKFIPLRTIQLFCSNDHDEKLLREIENKLVEKRLTYYSTADYFNTKWNCLVNLGSISIDVNLFHKWKNLLIELGDVHQTFLYHTAVTDLTIDHRCAFFIQLAEPLVELVKKHTTYFSTLKPGKKGTSLRKCLIALILKYGEDIFNKELSENFDKFLSVMVKSRVRITHIKNEQQNRFFDGPESYIYMLKMSLLYRKVIFEILGIEYEKYREQLVYIVSQLDEHEKIVQNFLTK